MKVWTRDGLDLHQGDVCAVLRSLAPKSVQCVVTSPPYWGLRSYNMAGQLGLEPTPEDYVSSMRRVFREVWRVLRDDGVLWLNIGDSYGHGGCGARDPVRWPKQHRNDHMPRHSKKARALTIDPKAKKHRIREEGHSNRNPQSGLKPKDMAGIPWRLAFGLQADGWYLRSDVIWEKSNPMPNSVRDRPTSAHEFIFLMSKQQSYFYDYMAIRERAVTAAQTRSTQDTYEAPGMPARKGLHKIKRLGQNPKQDGFGNPTYVGFNGRWDEKEAHGDLSEWRNKRDVWRLSTARSEEDHFAVFPEALVEPCVLAGSRPGDLVLDPFSGSGTTLAVAHRLGRRGAGIDLNPAYNEIAIRRLETLTDQRRLAL